jgi:hypothetical protein
LAAVAIAAVLVVRFVLLPRPAYSNAYGARVVHYTVNSRVLGRSLSEVAVLPPGDRRRPLLVFLHGRHDSRPWSWLIPSRSGPESVLSNDFFAALKQIGSSAPIVVVLNGGGHTYYHDRQGGRFGTAVLQDAIPDALARFRTTDRVAIGGISMAGTSRSISRRSNRLASARWAGTPPRCGSGPGTLRPAPSTTLPTSSATTSLLELRSTLSCGFLSGSTSATTIRFAQRTPPSCGFSERPAEL